MRASESENYNARNGIGLHRSHFWEMLALIYIGFLPAKALFHRPKPVESAKSG
jgi:hypothetical protein